MSGRTAAAVDRELALLNEAGSAHPGLIAWAAAIAMGFVLGVAHQLDGPSESDVRQAVEEHAQALEGMCWRPTP